MKKVPNLLTTDQKVGGSSPSKRTETQEDFTTSWVSLFPLVAGDPGIGTSHLESLVRRG